MNPTTLPAATREYLQSRTAPGSRNAQLFAASCQLRDSGASFDGALSMLFPCGVRDGLRRPEIEATVRSAYRTAAREPAKGRKSSGTPPRRTYPAAEEVRPPRIRQIPEAAKECWFEGLRFLESDESTIGRIAGWRRWDPSFVRTLAQDGLMGAPIVGGGRKVAFPVRSCGGGLLRLHVRPMPPDDGDWFYWPAVEAPALPLVIGSFDGAGMLIVTEGEWDVLTLCHAAGWFDHDAAWPEDICAIGIRGASAWRAFIEHFSPRWPNPAPSCLLLPDRDDEGRKWLSEAGDTFFNALRRRCRVVVTRGAVGAKDLNARHKVHPITRAEVAEMLLAAGLVDARGAVIREVG